MALASTQIMFLTKNNQRYFYSIVEKENDSGLLWNTRLLFLLEGKHFGYLSEARQDIMPHFIQFQKHKVIVPGKDITNLNKSQNDSLLQVKFQIFDNKNKMIEKIWLLRFASQHLRNEWYKKLKEAKEMSNFREQQKKIEIPQVKDKINKLKISRSFDLQHKSQKKQSKSQQKQAVLVPLVLQQKKIKKQKINSQQQLMKIMKESSKRSIIKTDQAIQPAQIQAKDISKSKLSDTPSKKDSSYSSQSPPAQEQSAPIQQSGVLKINSRIYMQSNLDKAKALLKLTQQPIDQSITFSNQNFKLYHEWLKSYNFMQVPWTYRYVKQDYRIFGQFKRYAEILMQQIVIDLMNSIDNGATRFKPKLFKQNLRYYDFYDVQIKLAFVSLQNKQPQNIKNKKLYFNNEAVKILTKQFNNFKALYEYLGSDSKLRVPLVTLCEYMGFVGLFKIHSRHLQRQVRLKQIQNELRLLQNRSKIRFNFQGNINRAIIQLNQKYYNGWKKVGDQELNFHLFFIQEIDQYLLNDFMVSNNGQCSGQLRKQFISSLPQNVYQFRQQKDMNDTQIRLQTQIFSKFMLDLISQTVVDLNSLKIYFMSSAQMTDYLHKKGINIRYIGHIYTQLTNTHQKNFFMSEIASRSCKFIFQKTLQDIVLEQKTVEPSLVQSRICSFFNCILGNTEQTEAFWKIISAYAFTHFGVAINFAEIDRNTFVLSLVQNCHLEVVWSQLYNSLALRSAENTFDQTNLIGINFFHKSYQAIHSAQYKIISQILGQPQSIHNFTTLINEFNLKNQSLPAQFDHNSLDLYRYLSYFISPEQANIQYSHLKLYYGLDMGAPSRKKLQIWLMQLKWHLKSNQKQKYLNEFNRFVRTVSHYYGEFHPIISELYELFCVYHLNNGDFEDAIIYAKSSLVNMLKICGGNHQRTSECYYQLALCYIKANNRQQAITHIKKAKTIFENNDKKFSSAYATITLKLALLLLNQNKIEECLQTTSNALQIYDQKTTPQTHGKYQNEITQCFELFYRCYECLNLNKKLQNLSIQAFERLQYTSRGQNLQKMLKIYLYPIFSQMDSQKAAILLQIIASIQWQPSKQNYQKAFRQIQIRIGEKSFQSSLRTYIQKIETIENQIKRNKLLTTWKSFEDVYVRETIKDFIDFVVELLMFLGQGFVSGSLRQAL